MFNFLRPALFTVIIFLTLSSQAFENVGLWKETKSGRYSKGVETLFDDWATKQKHLNYKIKSSEIRLIAVPSNDDDTYVGIETLATVKAGLNKVVTVLGNIKEYINIYPDLETIDETKFEKPDQALHWKFGGILGTHTVYGTIQRILKIGNDRAALIYRLTTSDDVLEADGIILLEEEKGITRYLSIDFFNAKWGIAGTFFKNKIWSTTCTNTGKATLAIKVAAEKLAGVSGADSEKVSVNCEDVENRKSQKDFEKLALNIFE